MTTNHSQAVFQVPLVSIIIVAYNAVDFIEPTIKSVIEKKERVNELIIIDGGSTDGTVEVIKKYKEYISYWVSETDKGIYDAMNKGWKQVNSDSYVLFLGCGDQLISLPDAESFNKADIIAGCVQIGNIFLYKPKKDIRLKLGNTLHHQALLIKKSLHVEPPFNLIYKTYADFDFNQRLYKAGKKICFDSKFKGYALEGGVSTKFDKKQSLEIVKKNYGWFYKILAIIYYKIRNEV